MGNAKAASNAQGAAWRPGLQMDDVIAQLACILRIVRDQNHRKLQASLQAVQLIAQGLAQGGIERGEGLIQQQGSRLRRQRASKGHALALAARELVRHLFGQRLDVQRFQPSSGLLSSVPQPPT